METTQTITGLAPGTYDVTVTDKADCPYIGSVVVTENPTNSTPTIMATPEYSCGAGQSITLMAGNCVGTLSWSHGLGTGTTKVVTPASSTTYSVTCTEGACTASAFVTVPVLINAVCTPTANNGLSPFFGVEQFQFNTINSFSGSSQSDGANYIDRSCTHSTTVNAGDTHPMTVDGTFTNGHVLKVYIDYNNNGDFNDAGEMVLSGSSDMPLVGNVTIPNHCSFGYTIEGKSAGRCIRCFQFLHNRWSQYVWFRAD